MTKKLSIRQLEKNLGFKLKRNIFCLAIDTATTSGIAMVKIDKKNVYIGTKTIKIPVIPKKERDQLEKAEKYEKALEGTLCLVRELKTEFSPKYPSLLMLEQSFLRFNPTTFGYLRALQGVWYAELYDSFDEIKIWLATVARKEAGFKSTLAKGSKSKDKKTEIMQWIGNIIEDNIQDDNEADALMLAFAGLKQ